MKTDSPLRVLFTGYAPVHFVCFEPLYKHLSAMPEVEVFLSGGLRTKSKSGVVHDEAALYSPFGIDPQRIIPTDGLGDYSFDVLFAANTKMILPGHVDARVQMFHGISFRNKAVRLENTNADYYFFVGPYMRRRFVDSGLMAADDPRALSIGFMKTDRLLNGTLDRSRILAKYGFDGTRPVLLFAPTGQKFNSLETMGESVIEQISRTDKYDLIIKPHDHPKNTRINWFERLQPLCGPHVQVARDLDVIPLLFVADLLISDASSVSSEYSLLNRPILFLDVPQLLERAQRGTGSQLDLESWGRHVGMIAQTPEEVVPMISESLANPGEFAPQRRAMATDLFYHPGAATESALRWFGATFLRQSAIHKSVKPQGAVRPASSPVAPPIHFDPTDKPRSVSPIACKSELGGEKK